MTARLSATQRRVLTYLAQGERLYAYSGESFVAGLVLRPSTVMALRERGLIAFSGGDDYTWTYAITAAGRAAREEEG